MIQGAFPGPKMRADAFAGAFSVSHSLHIGVDTRRVSVGYSREETVANESHRKEVYHLNRLADRSYPAPGSKQSVIGTRKHGNSRLSGQLESGLPSKANHIKIQGVNHE